MHEITYKCNRDFTKTLEVNDEVIAPETIENFVVFDSKEPEQIFCPECEKCEKNSNFLYNSEDSEVLHMYKTCFVSKC